MTKILGVSVNGLTFHNFTSKPKIQVFLSLAGEIQYTSGALGEVIPLKRGALALSTPKY